MKITRRVKIPTGLRCNIKCRFCYYWDKLDTENPLTEEIKAKLDYAKKHGIEDVDFSGGEPTLRKDLPELVSHAKKLGFKHICVITNGIMMSNRDYTNKLINNGLSDILFSLEGHNSEIHDSLTQAPGSFNKLMKAISFAKGEGIRVRTNTTVTSINYKYLPNLAELLLQIEPTASNFILFNDWCSAYKKMEEMSCKYSHASPYLKRTIDILNLKTKKITVRYIPFCFMVGYEKHVCNLLQKEYDTDEWVDSIKTRLLTDVRDKKASLNYWRGILRGIVYHPTVCMQYFRTKEDALFRIFHRSIIEQMREGYAKSDGCKKCKYYYLCDGLEKTYIKKWGYDELKPVIGKRILDFNYYRENYGNYAE